MGRSEKKRRTLDLIQDLVEYCRREEPGALERFFHDCPACLPLTTSFHLVPHPDMLHLQTVHETVDPSTLAASWAAANSRHSNLATALKCDWRQRHATIMPAPSLDHAAVPKPQPRPCRDHGVCVTTDTGKMLLAFRARLLAFLRQEMSALDGSTAKATLEARLVLQLDEEPLQPDPLLEEFRAATTANASEPTTSTSTHLAGSVFLHVALFYKKPFRPTFQLLRSGAELPGPRQECWQTHCFLTTMQLAQRLDLESTWHARLRTIMDTETPVDGVQPCRCVLRMGGDHSYGLWPPPPTARGKRGPDRLPRQRCKRSRSQTQTTKPAPAQMHATEASTSTATHIPATSSGSSSESAAADAPEQEQSGSDSDGFTEMLAVMDAHLWGMQEDAVIQQAEREDAGEEASEAEQDLLGVQPLEEVLQAVPEAMPEDVANHEENPQEEAVQAQAPPADEEILAGRDARQPEAQQEEAAAPLPQQRHRAELKAVVQGGFITYYATKRIFTATCSRPGHGRCVLTRTADPAGTVRNLLMRECLQSQSVFLLGGCAWQVREKCSFPGH